jgi:hypothetical protein
LPYLHGSISHGDATLSIRFGKPTLHPCGTITTVKVRHLAALLAALAGCGSSSNYVGYVSATTDGSAGPVVVASPTVTPVYQGFADAGVPGCPTGGLSCFVDTQCPANSSTSLTGTVFDPAGVTPLYNAIVYIPADPQALLPTITPGTTSCSASCGNEGSIGNYVSAAVTDAAGRFTLENVPTGTGIPLVIQLGKWRREITVDTTSCIENTVPASLARLPRNQSEGDIPQMAIVTGACDELACLMSDIGLDPGEFTGPGGGGRLHVYKGAGPGPDLDGGGPGPAGDCSGDACPLWSSTSALSAYDIVLLGCECGAHDETKPPAAIQAMHDWLGAGGRVLATHYQDTWFKTGPPDFQGVASWLPTELDGPTPGPFVTGSGTSTASTAAAAFESWLRDVGALDLDSGTPWPITLPPSDVSTSVTGTDAGFRWITDETTGDPKVLSFPTPIGGVLPEAGVEEAADQYCGRAMFTDVHMGGGGVPSTAPVPASCTGASSSAEQRALEYLFFQLSGPCASRVVFPTCACQPPPPTGAPSP